MSGEFESTVSGFTSDHAPVSAIVSTYNERDEALSLTGLTFNMLNHCNPNNNPFKIAESGADYVARKVKQLEFLAQHMKSDTFDFVALQEVDIFTQSPMPEFVRNFLSEVRSYGWQTTHTDSSDNTNAPLLTFYNTKKLDFISKKSVFPMDGTMKNCGLEATFKYIPTDNLVCITNIDLDYNTDFRETILKYQKQKITESKFTIIAGDANHPPELEYYSLVGDKVNRPTCIDSKLNLELVDGIMASPIDNQRVAVTEGPVVGSWEWVPATLISKLISLNDKDNENKRSGKFVCKIEVMKPSERVRHGSHLSLPGEPWIFSTYRHLLSQIATEKPKSEIQTNP